MSVAKGFLLTIRMQAIAGIKDKKFEGTV